MNNIQLLKSTEHQVKSSLKNSGDFSHNSNNMHEDTYHGEHSSPDSESGAPAHNLSGIFPDDIHTSIGAKHYGDNGGDSMDNESISVIQGARNKPNKGIKVYRAVPKILTNEEKVSQLYLEKNHYMKTGKVHTSSESKLTGSTYYTKISHDYDHLIANPTPNEPKLKINKGDWVTTSKAYATEHGRSNLKNKYRILSKTVKAKEIFNDGNIHEWGYHPQVTESTGYIISDIYLNEIYGIE